MTRPVPRDRRDAVHRKLPAPMMRLLVAALGALICSLAVLVPATTASADDGTAAWAVAPCDEAGAPTGETRFELEVEPGQSVTEHVLVTNSSTVERAFDVYGADGFNTPAGGYDVDAAAVAPTDVGSWVEVSASPVAVPALSTAVVELTITVPDGAAPGDHPGGLVVSPLRGQVTDDGVLVDTRIAVRLNVRVPGELAPALEVRRVGVSYGFTAVPFGPAPADVHYEVVNTGNVKVIGVPRLRITGPFGIRLAELDADETHEVLPGESFTVTTTVDAVAPLFLDTATVDVGMTAAPGPETEIPGVSATGRAGFAAVSWTGLAAVAVVVVGLLLLVRVLRRRRREGAQLWDRVVDEARADLEAGRAPRTAAGGLGVTGAIVALVGASMFLGVPHAQAVDTDDGSLTLTVPATTASPSPSPTSTPSSSPAPSSQTPPRRSSPTSPPRLSDTGGGAGAADGGAGAAGADAGVDEGSSSAARPGVPDLLRTSNAGRWSGLQWTLLGAGVAGVGGVGAWFARLVVLSRRGVTA